MNMARILLCFTVHMLFFLAETPLALAECMAGTLPYLLELTYTLQRFFLRAIHRIIDDRMEKYGSLLVFIFNLIGSSRSNDWRSGDVSFEHSVLAELCWNVCLVFEKDDKRNLFLGRFM